MNDREAEKIQVLAVELPTPDATLERMGENTSAKIRARKPVRTYPSRGLSDAVRVVLSIKEHNAGKPWPPTQLAEALDIAHRSTNFQYVLSACRDYGLIEGSARSPQVSLTTLGRDLAYPKNQNSEFSSRIQAFFNVELFKRVFDHYTGASLPEDKFLRNTLVTQFDVDETRVDEFVTIFRGNCSFCGISTQTGTQGTTISSERSGISVTAVQQHQKAPDKQLSSFVIMPFTEKGVRVGGFFSEVFENLIKPAATEIGFSVETANRTGSDIIQSTIINKLLDADLVIADLTDHNPNVLFELGLRMADGRKPVVIIKTTDTGRLFDVDNMMRVYEYDHRLWKSTIEKDLPQLVSHFKSAWEDRDVQPTYIDILRRRGNET